MKKHLAIFTVRIIPILDKIFTSIESGQNDPEIITCEATGCIAKAANKISVKVGNLGAIPLLLCSNCVTKFQDAEQI